ACAWVKDVWSHNLPQGHERPSRRRCDSANAVCGLCAWAGSARSNGCGSVGQPNCLEHASLRWERNRCLLRSMGCFGRCATAGQRQLHWATKLCGTVRG
ncbi:hypothetical protein TraAM80_00076, partial [Trypanosoma rangeli]